MAANAALIHYGRQAPPDPSYARPGVVAALDWWAIRKYRDHVRAMRAAGAEVVMYVLPYHDYPYGDDESADKGLFYTGQRRPYRRDLIPREWFWDPANPGRVEVGAYSGYVMDVREGSAFVEHLATRFFPAMAEDPTIEFDGYLLDVWGTGYRGQTSGLRDSEQAPMNAGIVAATTRWRGVLGERPILIANNSWLDPHPLLNGIVVERHLGGEINNGFWRSQLALVGRGLTVPRRRNVVIVNTPDEACAWASNPDATHVTAQTNYDRPGSALVLPYGPCGVGARGWEPGDHHVPADEPMPAPEPDPADPAPPPSQPVLRKPDAPTDVAAVVDPTTGEILVSWSLPAPADDVPAIDRVQVYLDGRPANLDVPVGTSYVLIGVAPGDHEVRVSCHNPVDYGPWSDPAVAVTVPEPAPVDDLAELLDVVQDVRGDLVQIRGSARSTTGWPDRRLGIERAASRAIARIDE